MNINYMYNKKYDSYFSTVFAGVRPYRCSSCDKAFTQRCSLESHCRKIHGVEYNFTYKERREKVYVCEECGHVTHEPEEHFKHIKERHPYSTNILRFFDKRQFKFGEEKELVPISTWNSWISDRL